MARVYSKGAMLLINLLQDILLEEAPTSYHLPVECLEAIYNCVVGVSCNTLHPRFNEIFILKKVRFSHASVRSQDDTEVYARP